MATNFTGAYVDPGVYVSTLPDSLSSNSAIPPTIICLVGDSQRFQTYTETVQLDITTPYTPHLLAQFGINESSVVVTDRYTNQVYTVGTDYTLTQISSVDGNALDWTMEIAATPSGGIVSGSTNGWVNISYQFTGSGYYNVYNFNSYNAMAQLYGQPFNSDGSINSPLSLAGRLAFLNGASQVLALAVQTSSPQPTVGDWNNSFAVLLNEPQIDVVIPVTGNTTIHANCFTNLVQLQSVNGIYLRGFVGPDGTASPVTPTNVIDEATMNFSTGGTTRMSVMAAGASNQVVNIQTGVVAGVVSVGAQYLAAACGGLFAGQPEVSTPITWKQVQGLYSIPNQVSETTQVSMQQSGVCVIAQRRNGAIYVKHGLTTDMANFLTQEISVQASQDKLYQLIQDDLLASNLIGSPLTSATATNVVGCVVGAITTAITTGLCQSYQGLQYQIPKNAPTTINVQFQYSPTLPLNYITVEFGINAQSGVTPFTTTFNPSNSALNTLQNSQALSPGG